MNQQTFEKFFQKPAEFIWSKHLQCYYEHQNYRFKYTEGLLGSLTSSGKGGLLVSSTIYYENLSG